MEIKDLKFEEEKDGAKTWWSFSLHDDRAVFKSSKRENDIVLTGRKVKVIQVAIFVTVLLGCALVFMTPWAIIESWLRLLG